MTVPNTTYDSLIKDIGGYLNAVSRLTTDQYPRFVMLACDRLGHELKGLLTAEPVTGTLIVGENTITKPANWLSSAWFRIGTGPDFNIVKTLFKRDNGFCREYWPDAMKTDVPEFYADYDFEHYMISPTPDQPYPFELNFYGTPVLNELVQTNWFTQHCPGLLLMACLLESAPWLKNDERLQTWQTLYDRGMAAITGENKSRKKDRAEESNE